MRIKKTVKPKTIKKLPYVQFSKILTGVFAVTMMPVSCFVIYRCLQLAEISILKNFTGALPYITAMIGFVEASVTIVLACYYSNSAAEKVAKAKYKTEKNNIKQDY